jgi:hypothetical protein
MPEPITRTASNTSRSVPRQRSRPQPPLLRELREQDWRTLVGTYRLLSRLVVQRTKHHLMDAADDAAREVVLVEDELAHLFPVRWPRRRSALLHEQATWWTELHDNDPATCHACQLQSESAAERTTPPTPRPVWK